MRERDTRPRGNDWRVIVYSHCELLITVAAGLYHQHQPRIAVSGPPQAHQDAPPQQQRQGEDPPLDLQAHWSPESRHASLVRALRRAFVVLVAFINKDDDSSASSETAIRFLEVNHTATSPVNVTPPPGLTSSGSGMQVLVSIPWPSIVLEHHPCSNFSLPPVPQDPRRAGPRPCPICYAPVDLAMVLMPASPSESAVIRQLSYVSEENLVVNESSAGFVFGGYSSLEQRSEFFAIKESMNVHCGGKKPGLGTGFDIDEADLFEMEQCHGVILALAIFGNYDIMQQPTNISEAAKETSCFYMFLNESLREEHYQSRQQWQNWLMESGRHSESSLCRCKVQRKDSTSVHARQGAGILVTLLVQSLGVELVPYAPLLVVPLLRCINDSDHAVRQSVTHSFDVLFLFLPLARGLPPAELSESLSRNTKDAKFLEQLLDNTHIDDYKLPLDLKVSLRRYQQEGINWLSFLRRFKLHGILCDDMGLGKTLQASAIVASDVVERRDCDNDNKLSLIICPSTLVGHWAYEIEKYIANSVMITLQYFGSAQDRMSLRGQFDRCNIVITSYDIVRKDIDYLGKLAWNYCILDEGHIIKNSKSKITAAVKQLKAQHRLILSGTPIQNNVLELWSLFDFLMPGFLGTERQFQATYGKPLLAAKDSKCSAKDAEAGVLALEALHKQVMPFLLRRTKDEVLSDLPEKIIQDRYCDLSPLQLKLYEQFSGSDAKREISTLVKTHETIATEETTSRKTTSHVFQALQYLLKLCSHPLLVVGENPSDSVMRLLLEVIPGCNNVLTELHELHQSPKLIALKEILEECGIGLDLTCSESDVSAGQHRVLIFAQHKSLLDIIERDLFHAHMKSITYLRLDGSVEPEKRFDIVKTFNSDPTIDVLLLTTHVGGLGLNLTSADTLVFMEHDWNPMKDHQAMDRAHRLGQRKVVNVHRLIMRGTLEEKVMSLQAFKVSVANAVINAENSSLKTMHTDQLLDLFAAAPTTKKGPAASSSSNGNMDGESKSMVGGKGLKTILSGLGELWDQSQYTEEYNLSQFLAKLNG